MYKANRLFLLTVVALLEKGLLADDYDDGWNSTNIKKAKLCEKVCNSFRNPIVRIFTTGYLFMAKRS